MQKIRVYDIAKELNVPAKDLVEKLSSLDISAKSHTSTISENEYHKVLEHYKKDSKKTNTGDKRTHLENNSNASAEQKHMSESPINNQTQINEQNNTKLPLSTPESVKRTQTSEQSENVRPASRPVKDGENTPNLPHSEGEFLDDRPKRKRRRKPPLAPGETPQADKAPDEQHTPERKPYQRTDGTPSNQSYRRREEGYQRPVRQEESSQPKHREDGSYQRQNYNRSNSERPPYDSSRPREGNQERPYQPYRNNSQQNASSDNQQSDGKRLDYQSRPRPDNQQRPDYSKPRGEYNQNRPYNQNSSRPSTGYNQNSSRPSTGYTQNSSRPSTGYTQNGSRPSTGYNQNSSRPSTGYTQNSSRPSTGYTQNSSRPSTGYTQNSSRPSTGYNQNRPRPSTGNYTQGYSSQQGNRPKFSSDRPQLANKDGGDRRFSRPAAAHDKNTSSKAAHDKPDKSERQQNLESKKIYKKEKTIHDKDSSLIKNNKTLSKTQQAQAEREKAKMEPRIIYIPPLLTLKELAEKMGVSGAELVKTLVKKGQMIGINNEISFELAADIALNYNVIAEEVKEADIFEEAFSEEPEDDSLKVERPPVVVVMGHVDHGKTSLLDAIRHTNVTKGEAGGITQHIGAYSVSINNKPITFLDTPGHEAFTAMRMRGAKVTDIAVLVVAADDGVMPQTIEAISHAKAAGVEIIVAINKIDKPSANPDRVKQELVEYGLVSDEWGGDTTCVPVSATLRRGIDHLLEMIILIAEMKELKANPNKRARGIIIEALLDKGRGPVATALIQEGTVSIGDPIVAGTTHGKVRAMIDDKGKRVKKAGPSMPVEILGLPDVPNAGDMFYVAANDKQARSVAEAYYAKNRVEMTKAQSQKVSLGDLFSQIQAGKIKELNIIIKADVQGSVEAVKQSIEKLSNEEVRIKTIHGNVGAIIESDVALASTSNAIIIGFNVRPEPSAKAMAEEQNVDIKLYRVIYNAIEDIQSAMKGLLDPVYEEKSLGKAEIRQIFKASGVGTIGGSYVLEGKFIRNASVRIIRNGIVVFEGNLDSLKRFKDDVKEVNAGYECGLLFERFNDIKLGDIVEAFVLEEIKR